MLPLHIFEERYKAMIHSCVEENAPFGVVLFEGESESASSIRRVGVLGRVVQVERLDDGRLNILTEGEARFRVVKFLGQHPHWRALVELLHDEREPESVLKALGERMARLYLDAYQKGLELTGKEGGELRLPTSPVDLSYMVGYVLDMDLDRKQALLETTSARERLRVLIRYLSEANAKLDQQLTRKRLGEAVSRNGDLGHPGG
jgi:Lon protease-like protein